MSKVYYTHVDHLCGESWDIDLYFHVTLGTGFFHTRYWVLSLKVQRSPCVYLFKCNGVNKGQGDRINKYTPLYLSLFCGSAVQH